MKHHHKEFSMVYALRNLLFSAPLCGMRRAFGAFFGVRYDLLSPLPYPVGDRCY